MYVWGEREFDRGIEPFDIEQGRSRVSGVIEQELLQGGSEQVFVPTLTPCDYCHSTPIGLFVWRDNCHNRRIAP